MNRIHSLEPISFALDLLPPGIRRRVEHVDWLTGVSPIFAGLHPHRESPGYEGTDNERDPHCHWQQQHEATTIVLPQPVPVAHIVHELGHILDEAICFDRHTPDPVSWYATHNTWEAFAEAFMLWAAPDFCHDASKVGRLWPENLAADHETLALFEELSR